MVYLSITEAAVLMKSDYQVARNKLMRLGLLQLVPGSHPKTTREALQKAGLVEESDAPAQDPRYAPVWLGTKQLKAALPLRTMETVEHLLAAIRYGRYTFRQNRYNLTEFKYVDAWPLPAEKYAIEVFWHLFQDKGVPTKEPLRSVGLLLEKWRFLLEESRTGSQRATDSFIGDFTATFAKTEAQVRNAPWAKLGKLLPPSFDAKRLVS